MIFEFDLHQPVYWSLVWFSVYKFSIQHLSDHKYETFCLYHVKILKSELSVLSWTAIEKPSSDYLLMINGKYIC